MVTCEAIDRGNTSIKKETIEVKGWHKAPTLYKLKKSMKLPHAVKPAQPNEYSN